MKIIKCKLKNDQQVLGVLKKNTKGLTAYGVLREIQRYKNIKPMTIYRSLKNLQKMGVVHKSNQSKNYFVCHSDSNEGNGLRVFKYSNSNVFMTTVVNEPKVEEITSQYE